MIFANLEGDYFTIKQSDVAAPYRCFGVSWEKSKLLTTWFIAVAFLVLLRRGISRVLCLRRQNCLMSLGYYVAWLGRRCAIFYSTSRSSTLNPILERHCKQKSGLPPICLTWVLVMMSVSSPSHGMWWWAGGGNHSGFILVLRWSKFVLVLREMMELGTLIVFLQYHTVSIDDSSPCLLNEKRDGCSKTASFWSDAKWRKSLHASLFCSDKDCKWIVVHLGMLKEALSSMGISLGSIACL